MTTAPGTTKAARAFLPVLRRSLHPHERDWPVVDCGCRRPCTCFITVADGKITVHRTVAEPAS